MIFWLSDCYSCNPPAKAFCRFRSKGFSDHIQVWCWPITLLPGSAGGRPSPISCSVMQSAAVCHLYGLYRVVSLGSNHLAPVIHQLFVLQCGLSCSLRKHSRDDLHTASQCRWALHWSADCSSSLWLSLQMIVPWKKCLFSRWGPIECTAKHSSTSVETLLSNVRSWLWVAELFKFVSISDKTILASQISLFSQFTIVCLTGIESYQKKVMM